MAYVLAYNTTNGPLVIDGEGHVLGSREWGPVNPRDEVAKGLLDDSRLVRVDKPSKAADPRATAAQKETDRLNESPTEPATSGAKES